MGGGKKGGSKGGGSKKKKSYTKAQQMAKNRIAAGKTISSVKAANKKSMQDAARARNATFQANRKLKSAGGTSAQVAKDNAMYGNTVPAGSFGISEAGKAQAAANLAARTAPEGAFGISAAGRKQAAAQLQEKRAYDKAFTNLQARDPGMAKYISSLPANVRTDALIGGQTRAAGVELGIGLGTLAAGKALLGGGLFKAATPGLGYKGTQVGFTGMGKTGFDAISKGAKYIASNKPQILGKGAYSAPTFKGAMRYAGKTGSLGGAQTPGGVIKSIVSGKAPRIGFIESQAKVSPGMFDKGVNLANKLSQGAYGKSALANTFRNQMATGIAPGGGIGSSFTGANLGKLGIATAGGLNISGGVDSEGGEAAEGSSTGRTVVTTDKDKNISYDGLGIAKDVALGSLDAITGNRFDFDNLGRPSDDKTPSQKFETFKKSPLQQAIISKQLGIDAKRIINEGGPAADSLMKNYISQIDSSSAKGIRNPIARLFRDTAGENQTDATAMAGRAMSAFSVDDPNFSNDPNALTKALRFTGLPQLSEENVQDIRHTFNKTVTEDTGIPGKGLTNIPYSQALGLANRITSGKIKDGVEESMNQLNMKSVPTLDDAVALGSQFATNMKTEGTVTQKRMQELDTLYKKFGPGGGQAPTIPSIIKGIGGPRRTGGSGTNLTISGGNNMTATIPDAVTPEILPLPTTVAQGGTNATDLAQIQQQAYNNQLSIYGMNPNYFAQIQQPRFNTRPKRFRQVFNRGYF